MRSNMFPPSHQAPNQLGESSRRLPPNHMKPPVGSSNLFALTSSFQMAQLDAVIIRNLTYKVGRGSNKKTILDKINLTVPEGSIYGLLGPSGCGKTTMLRCVVGRIWPKSGSVLVFGHRPGSGQGEVPGRDVGYMPQDISIYEDFTIEETLRYFGKINRMKTGDIRKRIEFLLQFLDLPSKKRIVTNLSGGQKRRVSLAAALVHSPPLLILDEPTVGVDPLLRQGIWQHLVSLTKVERISVIITTHYIEEARLANVVGLMRHGKILAEDSPEELMHKHNLLNLEDVFLKLCVTDSSRRAASLANSSSRHPEQNKDKTDDERQRSRPRHRPAKETNSINDNSYSHRWNDSDKGNKLLALSQQQQQLDSGQNTLDRRTLTSEKAPIRIHTGTNKVELNYKSTTVIGYDNEAVEVFSSEEEDEDNDDVDDLHRRDVSESPVAATGGARQTSYRQSIQNNRPPASPHISYVHSPIVGNSNEAHGDNESQVNDYLAMQTIHWAARRSNALNYARIGLDKGRYSGLDGRRPIRSGYSNSSGLYQWFKTLLAVTWKNYIRLRRNPPVLVFQFMLPAIQVILFCLCIGGEPFDVPVAIVNDEVVPKSSLQFLNGLNKKIIRQIKYDNLTSAMEAVRRGKVWGAIHIPDKYSENLQSRLIMGEEVTNETISNGTIKVYPDLTNLHLAMALETTFRETFINFARDSLEELGYDRSLADLPIQVGKPVYGTMRKDGYLEFMAPGVVISISYVMATGLTALAFILERRDGLLERSLVSGVQTMQILLAHAINQVFVMIIQIFLVLGCTFFIFEIPSRGPFFWVVLLILLQGCTGMGFGLLVSAICAEENTAVMMVVGTFYTNLILAGIIWPIEAMPHWLRPLSYAQPQTLPTDTLRHILSRGWGITEPAVLLGFAVTIGWLVVFLVAAGAIFKYSR